MTQLYTGVNTGQTVVMYNAGFDLGKLWSSARVYSIEIPYDSLKTVCAMHLFARVYGEYHEYFGTYTWQKLNEVAIPYLQIQLPGQAHDAAHDAAATAAIIKKLAELADRELPPGWHPPVDVPCAGCGRVVRECAEADEIWYCHAAAWNKESFTAARNVRTWSRHRRPVVPTTISAPTANS